MKLLELFDQHYKYRWTRAEPEWWTAEFKPDDGGLVNVSLMANERGLGEGIWEVEFNRGNMAKGKSETTNITGEGDAFKIFGTVSMILKEFVKSNKVEELFFSADEPSRHSLYTRMMPRLAALLGMKMITSHGQFVLKRVNTPS